MSAIFSPSVRRPFTCTYRKETCNHVLVVGHFFSIHLTWVHDTSEPVQRLCDATVESVCAVETCALRVQTHPLVINGEVIVELDDAFSSLLELLVRLLRPPLLEVAVAIVLAP